MPSSCQNGFLGKGRKGFGLGCQTPHGPPVPSLGHHQCRQPCRERYPPWMRFPHWVSHALFVSGRNKLPCSSVAPDLFTGRGRGRAVSGEEWGPSLADEGWVPEAQPGPCPVLPPPPPRRPALPPWTSPPPSAAAACISTPSSSSSTTRAPSTSSGARPLQGRAGHGLLARSHWEVVGALASSRRPVWEWPSPRARLTQSR